MSVPKFTLHDIVWAKVNNLRDCQYWPGKIKKIYQSLTPNEWQYSVMLFQKGEIREVESKIKSFDSHNINLKKASEDLLCVNRIAEKEHRKQIDRLPIFPHSIKFDFKNQIQASFSFDQKPHEFNCIKDLYFFLNELIYKKNNSPNQQHFQLNLKNLLKDTKNQEVNIYQLCKIIKILGFFIEQRQQKGERYLHLMENKKDLKIIFKSALEQGKIVL